MPDQNQTQAVPQPVQQQPQQQGQPKKSNACLIVVIVAVGLLIILGVGGYFTYRYLKGKVTDTLKNSSTSSTSSGGSTSTSSGETTDQTVTNDYNNAKAVTPTTDMSKAAQSDIEAVIKPIFGGAKLTEWMNLNSSEAMTFLLPRKVTSADFAAIDNGFIQKGYSRNANYTTSEDTSVYFTKSNIEILLGCTAGEVKVSATVSQAAQ